MLVLDRSGSMALPFDSTPPACGSLRSVRPAGVRPGDLSLALGHGDHHHVGLPDAATRPSPAWAWPSIPQLTGATITDPTSGNASNFCTATSTVDVPIVDSDDDRAAAGQRAGGRLCHPHGGPTASPLAGGVGGGTPTGDSLTVHRPARGLRNAPSRQSFLLLMTDGLPNCNPNSGLDANVNPAACDCTDGADLERLHASTRRSTATTSTRRRRRSPTSGRPA